MEKSSVKKVNQDNQIFTNQLVPLKQHEERFLFIKDSTLRKNIAITFEYIILLVKIAYKQEQRILMTSAIYKDIIVYTATIIESCLHYCLEECIKSKIVNESKVMSFSWIEESCVNIYRISNDKKVCSSVKHKKIEKLTGQTNFLQINRACKRANILTDKLFKKSEELREQRNKIHLKGLREIDGLHNSQKADYYFSIATKIIDVVKRKIN